MNKRIFLRKCYDNFINYNTFLTKPNTASFVSEAGKMFIYYIFYFNLTSNVKNSVSGLDKIAQILVWTIDTYQDRDYNIG